MTSSSPHDRGSNRFTVGVVDDDHVRRDRLERLLSGAGYRVLVPPDLADEEVDLVVVSTRGEQERLVDGGHGAVHLLAAGEGVTTGDRQELLLRVAVLCRRGRAERRQVSAMRLCLVLDPADLTAGGSRRRASLTVAEYRLLAALVAGRGRAVRRESLRRAAWGASGAPSANSLHSCIRRLRAKLGSLELPVELLTIRGHGYQLVAV
jgi:DNA-binding response OmpR family regulator